MKAVVYTTTIALLMVFLLLSPFVSAQDEDEGDGSEGCIFATFCLVMLFLAFLAYISMKRKSEESKEEGARMQYQQPPSRFGYRYPPRPPTYPPRRIHKPTPEPQKREVKCDVCSSKNLRTFEGGYFKCNDCKHVFFISESYRGKRR